MASDIIFHTRVDGCEFFKDKSYLFLCDGRYVIVWGKSLVTARKHIMKSNFNQITPKGKIEIN